LQSAHGSVGLQIQPTVTKSTGPNASGFKISLKRRAILQLSDPPGAIDRRPYVRRRNRPETRFDGRR
jgi:hypothetical protein